MKIVWSPLAIERVSEIAQYIAQDDPVLAEKWVDAIFDKVERLEDFPQSGRKIPELQRSDLREIVFSNYRIVYQLDQNRVSILTVRHSRQLLPLDEIRDKE